MTEIFITYAVVVLLLVWVAYVSYRKSHTKLSMFFCFAVLCSVFACVSMLSELTGLSDTQRTVYLIMRSPNNFRQIDDSLQRVGIDPEIRIDLTGGGESSVPNNHYLLEFKKHTFYSSYPDALYLKMIE